MGISFHGGPAGDPGRGLLSQAFERRVQACFGDAAFLSMGPLRGAPRSGALYWAF
jgi:hypothetical protein